MKNTLKRFFIIYVAEVLFGILVTSADAKLRHKYFTKSTIFTSQPVENGWDSDLDSNWGYDYSLNPSEFGQNLNGPVGDFGYGGW